MPAAPIVGISLAAALAVGILGGALVPGWPVEPPHRLALFALTALVVPALLEELAFRYALLPAPRRAASLSRDRLWVRIGFANAAYVGWHPIAGIVLLPEAWPIFSDPAFLGAVACLGIGLSVAYLASGRLTIAIGIHWGAVMAWKLVLGGPILTLP